jgi:hypothetical protein
MSSDIACLPNPTTHGGAYKPADAAVWLPPPHSTFPAMLKGVDRLLHAAMCENLGFKGSFRPVHLALNDEQKPDK